MQLALSQNALHFHELTIYAIVCIYASMKFDADAMALQASAATDMLKALANPHRLMILCQLFGGERTVGDLATGLGLRISTMSQHLGLLRRDGLVATRREAQTIKYRLADDVVRRLLETLFTIYCPNAISENPTGAHADDPERIP